MGNDVVSLQRRAVTITGAVFLPLGLVFTLLGFALGWWTVLPDASRARAEATITAVGASTVTVAYEVDGRAYQARLTESFDGDTVGKRIEVAYKTDTPTSVRSVRGGLAVLAAFGGVGVSFVALGAGFLVWARAGERRRDALLREGNRLDARITGVEQNKLTRIRGRYPWVIRCEGVMVGSPDPIRFASELWLDDPTPIIQRAGVTTLPVYVDPARPGRRYAVDDSALRMR